MAKIVFSMAASHTPMLTLEGKRWSERAADDLKNKALNPVGRPLRFYDELARNPAAPTSRPKKIPEIEAVTQKALDRMADELEKAWRPPMSW